MTSPWPTVTAERLALADLLEPLRGDQWRARSLCPAWTVHEVLAHLVMPLRPGAVRRLLPALVRARGDREQAMAASAVAIARRRSPEELLGALREHATSTFTPPGADWRAPLSDVLLHRLDVAHPLGLRVQRPLEPWADVLDHQVASARRAGRGRAPLPEVHLEAADLGWQQGSGPRVRGGAVALAATLSGRTVLLDDLSGAGLPALREWLAR